MWVWDGVYGVIGCLHLHPAAELGFARAPAKTVPNFDPSVFQLSYGCADVLWG